MTTVLDRFLRTTRYAGHVRSWQSVPEIATSDDEPGERDAREAAAEHLRSGKAKRLRRKKRSKRA